MRQSHLLRRRHGARADLTAPVGPMTCADPMSCSDTMANADLMACAHPTASALPTTSGPAPWPSPTPWLATHQSRHAWHQLRQDVVAANRLGVVLGLRRACLSVPGRHSGRSHGRRPAPTDGNKQPLGFRPSPSHDASQLQNRSVRQSEHLGVAIWATRVQGSSCWTESVRMPSRPALRVWWAIRRVAGVGTSFPSSTLFLVHRPHHDGLGLRRSATRWTSGQSERAS